jgi:Lar family restriction alleviation protein
MNNQARDIMKPKNDDLMPCPFCGDKAYLVEADALSVWYVHCECCGARHEATTKQRAIVAWNNRRANGLVNWLEAEAAKYQEAISRGGPIGSLQAKDQEVRRCRKMVKRLMGQ